MVGVALVSASLGALAMRVVTPAGTSSSVPAASANTQKYTCPMHPSVVMDHSGECPICGMQLVTLESGSAAGSGERKIAFYRSPMNPEQTSPTKRKDEMGMDYVPVYEDDASASVAKDLGLATVNIDPQRQQLIGLRTAEATQQRISGQIRTTGRVAMDETRVHHVNVKNTGFVERVFANYVGKAVRRGDPLFSVYSPELLAAQEELLSALRARLPATSGDAARDANKTLVDAARRRLALFDVPAADIARLEETGQALKAITVYSPASGVVTKKDVVDGMKLEAGAMPYEIVDLSTVWGLADVYENELRFVKLGATAMLHLKAFPDREFSGKVVFIDPLLDANTRTVKVRLTFANPAGDLRPEMFGEVTLELGARDGIVVPSDAVIDSGTKKIVFVAQGDGKFAPREVELGWIDGANVEVTRGLSAGEKVVTRANFLVDSESRLRASLNDMAQPESARVLPSVTDPHQRNTP